MPSSIDFLTAGCVQIFAFFLFSFEGKKVRKKLMGIVVI